MFKWWFSPLTDFLSHLALFRLHVHGKGFLEESYYILTYDYFLVLWFLYESGAILGRARRDCLDALEKTLVIPNEGTGAPVCPSLKDCQFSAKERLRSYRDRFRREPETFEEFIFIRESELAVGYNPHDACAAFHRGNKKPLKLYDKKIPLIHRWDGCVPEREQKQRELREFILQGIGFGSIYPDLTEKMNRNYWDFIRADTEWLSEALSIYESHKSRYKSRKSSEVEVPEPKIMNLEEQERAILNVVEYWMEEHLSELADPLYLKAHPVDVSQSVQSISCLDDYGEWLDLMHFIDEHKFLITSIFF